MQLLAPPHHSASLKRNKVLSEHLFSRLFLFHQYIEGNNHLLYLKVNRDVGMSTKCYNTKSSIQKED
uniref:Uncharacterized protein n=1 Tax=Cucumis melo TaxID=3656 RepID=A0A9I9EDB4_CUCME